MKDLHQDVRDEIRKVHGTSPFLELWQITVDVTVSATTLFAIVNHPEPVTYASIVYYPFPFRRGPIDRDSDGSLPKTSISVSNVTRFLAPYLEVGKGLIGCPATRTIVHKANVVIGKEVAEDTFRILGARVTKDDIVLDLGVPSTLDEELPRKRFYRDRCTAIYQDPETCGFANDPGDGSPLTTCDHTLSGTNGCIVHGDREVTNGQVRRHPLMMNAFPAINVVAI